MSQSETIETSLKVTKEFSASIEKVYQAWTDPDQVVKWMGPGEVSCKNVEIDLKVGGRYLIHMVSDEGDHIAEGTYQEIIPNKKLQYTWGWQSGTVVDSVITVEFVDKGDTTEVTLLHEKLPSKEAAEKHTQGWNGCLCNLENYLK